MAGHHHERPDGKGYPNGIGDTDLELGGRVIAVADVYQALKADRPCRQGLEESQIMEMLTESAGAGLDPDATNALKELF
jgi:HD-GYP domain-containing protein (c-di-GMP phosphodiesterase class II)